jgi:hypothetical protein
VVLKTAVGTWLWRLTTTARGVEVLALKAHKKARTVVARANGVMMFTPQFYITTYKSAAASIGPDRKAVWSAFYRGQLLH